MSKYRHIGFGVLAALLPLAAGELAVRVFDMAKGAGPQGRTAWFWGYTQDRLLGFRPQPNKDIVFAGGRNHLDTNADGFRDQDFDQRLLAGKRVIFCVGESSTWGTGATTRSATWPHQLSLILSQQDPGTVVLNAGMPGYTMVENLQLLNLRLLKYRPEAVLYMGFRNDVEFYAASLSDQVDLNFYPRRLATIAPTWFNRLCMRSALIGLAVSRLGDIVPLDRQGVSIPGARAHLSERGKQTMRDQIMLMAALCARHGARLLWIDQPIDYKRTGDSVALEEGRAVIREELETDRIPLLQAHTLYDRGRYPMIDDVHFTDEGNRYLAQILAPQVARELLPAPAR